MSYKIAIIGSGNIGGALGKHFAKAEQRKKGLLESEWTASYFPGAQVMTAFNTIYAKTLETRVFDEKNPSLYPPAKFSAAVERDEFCKFLVEE